MAEDAEKKPKGFLTPKLVVGAVLVVLAIVVVAQNSETVDTHLLFWTISMPRVVLLGVMLAIGFATGWMTGRRRKKKA